MIENVDRRVLAGFRCVDAITGSSVSLPLKVDAPNLLLWRNRSGIFAVMDAPGLTDLTKQFLPPNPALWPAPKTFEVTIKDPSFRYLSRRAQIAVPQPLPADIPPDATPPVATTTPAGTTTAGPTTTLAGGPTTTTTAPATTTTLPAGPPAIPPVTTPQDVLLFPTPAAAVSPNWAVMRISVISNATPPQFLPWVAIQISISGKPTLSGLTNQAGQALAAVPGLGLQLSASSTGSVTEATTPATIKAWFDPSNLDQPTGFVPNPDDILRDLSSTRLKTASKSVQLAPGQTIFVNLTISVI